MINKGNWERGELLDELSRLRTRYGQVLLELDSADEVYRDNVQGDDPTFKNSKLQRLRERMADTIASIRSKDINTPNMESQEGKEEGSESHLCPMCNAVDHSPVAPWELLAVFPKRVGARLVLKRGKHGLFWGCENYRSDGCTITRYTEESERSKNYYWRERRRFARRNYAGFGEDVDEIAEVYTGKYDV